MKIINSGTPLTGLLDVGSDWLLRLPGTATFPGSGFTDGFIVAKFQLPTALSILEVVTPSASTLWYSPPQEVQDFFPNYGMGERETITTTLPESITISRSSDTSDETNAQNGTEVINTVDDGLTNVNSNTRVNPDVAPNLIQNRETIQYRPWKTMKTGITTLPAFGQGNLGYAIRGGVAPSGGMGYGSTLSTGGPSAGREGEGFIAFGQSLNPELPPSEPRSNSNQTVTWHPDRRRQGTVDGQYGTIWPYTITYAGQALSGVQIVTEPDSEVTDDSKLVIGSKTSDIFTQIGSAGGNSSLLATATDNHNTSKRDGATTLAGSRNGLIVRQGEETRTGGTQITQTERSVPAAIRYGLKNPRISYDPNTISLAFSYMPVAEVRLTDTTGKVGISCMYSIRVESNPVQAIAPADRSSPVRLPNTMPFKITAYMSIRTETEFGKFGSAREEARKVSLRTISATSDKDILLDRKMKIPSGGTIPLGELQDPGQLGVAALSYVADLGARLRTSNFGFPLLNDAHLLINKKGRNLEFMVGNQVLTWEDASVGKTFGVQVVGPTPSYTQSPTPRKSLVYS